MSRDREGVVRFLLSQRRDSELLRSWNGDEPVRVEEKH